MQKRHQNRIHYGKSDIKIILSTLDELLLKEILNDRDRWTRITPNGYEKYEPLFERLDRVDSKSCIIKPGPYVGRIELNDSDLLFLPPTWLNGLNTAHLMYMLIKSSSNQTKTIYLHEFISKNQVDINGLNEPLYSNFTNELYKALKKGTYKSYDHKGIVSSNLRGKINFLKQANLNFRGKALFATEQEVFSEDNDVNQLLFLATKIVLQDSSIQQTTDKARQIKRLLPDFTRIKNFNPKRINLARRGYHLKSSIELAKLIISGKSISYEGDLGKTFSIVINLFDLFENYISSELSLRDNHYNNHFQLKLTSSHSKNISWGNRKVYPDLVYISDSKKIVIDTKLKNISKFGPKIDDVYQIYFYSTMLGLENGILIYPINSNTEQIFRFPLDYSGINRLEIIVYGLPVVKSFEEMSLEIDKLHEFLLKTP